MNQESLFPEPRARVRDPDTSKRAARRVAPNANAVTGQILDLLERYRFGLTKDEICRNLGVEPRYWPTVASALSRLKKKGWLTWVELEPDPTQPPPDQHLWALRAGYVDIKTTDVL